MNSCLARAGQRKRARSTLEEAIDAGLIPNSYMFNAAMGACTKPAQVFELHSRMQIAGIQGDEVTQCYLVSLAHSSSLLTPDTRTGHAKVPATGEKGEACSSGHHLRHQDPV
jgi:hypothetical protein